MALDVEMYRKKLMAARDELEQQIGTVAELSEPAPDDLQLTAADAPVMGEIKDVQAAVVDMQSDRLERINAALQSIDEGTYGICKTCGKPIDPRRLDVEPEAITCMDCLSAKELEFTAPTM
jgi:RNA polymerase-binding transcription factor DksA